MLNRSHERAAWSFLQAAMLLMYERVSISIRAVSEVIEKSISPTLAIDIFHTEVNIATKSFIQALKVDAKEIIEEIETWIARHGMISGRWLVGTRTRSRIHPYDDEECKLPTCAWVVFEADSPADADNALRKLKARGYHTPVDPTHHENHRQVFACLYRFDWN